MCSKSRKLKGPMEKENHEHKNGESGTSQGLAKMFAEGNKAIATQK